MGSNSNYPKDKKELSGLTIAGRYRLIKHLGSGSQGSVYLAEDIKLDTEWALKMIPSITGDELTALKRVSHPAFPRIVDVADTDHGTALVMDYIPGQTIGEYCAAHTLSIDMLCEWALEIADAMRYLHSITPTILYMDCKPSNIILGEDGHLHLVDLGSAYVTGVSGAGRISGTLPYAAPEQRRGLKVDVRSDIYALGMTLKTVGRLPSGRFTLLSYIKYRLKYDKRLQALSSIVDRCISDKPEDRYQSADEFIYHLQHPDRIGYRLPSAGVLLRHLADILYKNVVTVFSVLSFHMFSRTGGFAYMALGVMLFVLLICLSVRRKPTTVPNIWHCYKDVYLHDLSGALLLILLCILLTKDHSYAASGQELNQVGENLPDVTIYDSEGAKVLYKGQYVVSDGDSLYLYIPTDSLNAGHLPARIEVR